MEHADTAASYDAWAETYDSDVNATRDLNAAVLRSSGLDLDRRDVVELGCGTGKNTEFLAARAGSVIGLDFSRGMLARARARITAPHVRFAEHDVRRPWPIATSGADVVVANLVLEHVATLETVYMEAVRALRVGGRLLICELHPERQRRGGQAQFRDARTGGVQLIPAHLHTVAEYVNDGIAAGLQLERLGEWLEGDAPAGMPPRLLSLQFMKPGT